MSTNQLCPQSQHQDPEIFGTDSLQSIDGFTNLKRMSDRISQRLIHIRE